MTLDFPTHNLHQIFVEDHEINSENNSINSQDGLNHTHASAQLEKT